MGYKVSVVRGRSPLLLSLIVACVLAAGAAVIAAAAPSSTRDDTNPAGLFPGLKDQGSLPGDPVAGVAIFRGFCSGCHNMKAAGIEGTVKLGTELDARKPTFTKIVTLITSGGQGGAASKALLKQLTYEQIYDVAKFVALYAGKAGPVPGATLYPPTPIPINVALKGGTATGRLSATLADRAFKWQFTVKGTTAAPVGTLTFAPNTGLPPISLNCVNCPAGSGFVVLSRTQTLALERFGAALTVQAGSRTLRGTIDFRR